MTISRYEFQGTPSAMGEQHGEALRETIGALASERIELILDECKSVRLRHIRDACESALRYIEMETPEVFKEVSGIARASGLELWKLAVAGGYSDIEHRARFLSGETSPTGSHECTLVLVRDSGGHAFLAGTWDSHATATSALVCISRRPCTGPATLALSTAGWPMQQGLTARGLGFAIANLVPRTSHSGHIFIAVLPHLASCSDSASASRELKRFHLCSGRYFAFADRFGGIAGIETDGRHYWTGREPSVHTNHYRFPVATRREGRLDYVPASESRRLSAEKRVAQLAFINPASLMSALWYHDGTPASIVQTGGGRDTRTGAAFVVDTMHGRLHFRSGALATPVDESLSLRYS